MVRVSANCRVGSCQHLQGCLCNIITAWLAGTETRQSQVLAGSEALARGVAARVALRSIPSFAIGAVFEKQPYLPSGRSYRRAVFGVGFGKGGASNIKKNWKLGFDFSLSDY